jgi:hypothetical protein
MTGEATMPPDEGWRGRRKKITAEALHLQRLGFRVQQERHREFSPDKLCVHVSARRRRAVRGLEPPCARLLRHATRGFVASTTPVLRCAVLVRVSHFVSALPIDVGVDSMALDTIRKEFFLADSTSYASDIRSSVETKGRARNFALRHYAYQGCVSRCSCLIARDATAIVLHLTHATSHGGFLVRRQAWRTWRRRPSTIGTLGTCVLYFGHAWTRILAMSRAGV